MYCQDVELSHPNSMMAFRGKTSSQRLSLYVYRNELNCQTAAAPSLFGATLKWMARQEDEDMGAMMGLDKRRFVSDDDIF